MYKNVVLTDDNFDEELEELIELMDIDPNSYNSFVEHLESEFTFQINNSHEEWVRSAIKPNKNSDFRQASQQGQLAYEYANGFLIFDYEVVL